MLKVVLSGGPCAGKSTSISKVSRELSEKLGLHVFIIPEAATQIIQSGIVPGNKVSTEVFQELVLERQLHQEEMVLDIVKRFYDPDKVVIILDRGILDQFAYVSDDVMMELLKKKGMDLSDVIARYDKIIHMVTAAKGTDVYTTENNSARSETAEEAIVVDERTLAGNMKHPNMEVVDNSTDFDQKVNRVISIIFDIVGAPAPMEIERKFLIKKPDIENIIEKNGIASISEIVQTYLKSSNDSCERRIRQRKKIDDNTNGFTFTYTEKTALPGTEVKRIEREKLISMKEYVNLMSEADTNLRQIRKNRYCFMYEGQYFELDIYDEDQVLPFEKDFAILEIELADENAEVRIPDFIEVVKEVTDDKAFKNHSIAKII